MEGFRVQVFHGNRSDHIYLDRRGLEEVSEVEMLFEWTAQD